MSLLHEKVSTDVSLDEFSTFFFLSYPEADKEVYQGLFKALEEAEISEEVGDLLLSQIKRRKEALKASEELFKISQGAPLPEDLLNRLKDLCEDTPNPGNTTQVVTTNLEELLNSAYKDSGYRWRLQCLNKSLGSLRRGDFGFIFARPETGKTTFLASEVTSFLSQQAAKVVWFNNEEQGNKVMLRVYQAYFGVTLEQLLSNVKKYHETFQKEVGERFTLVDSGSLSRRDCENVVSEKQPDIVIYDQLDKIRGFTADREDLVLGAKYQWARELAKNSHASIGVCQADGTAEGVCYLTMEHVANAKTAKQAEADFILGIGKAREPHLEFVRYLNISKNKLFGDQDSIPEWKHGRFEALIRPLIARYEDTYEHS